MGPLPLLFWPSGRIDRWTALPGDSIYILVEGTSSHTSDPTAQAPFRVVPNPARNKLFFDLPHGVDALAVFDPTGRMVRRLRCNGTGRLEWNRTDGRGARLPAGTYFVAPVRSHIRRGRTTREIVGPAARIVLTD